MRYSNPFPILATRKYKNETLVTTAHNEAMQSTAVMTPFD